MLRDEIRKYGNNLLEMLKKNMKCIFEVKQIDWRNQLAKYAKSC